MHLKTLTLRGFKSFASTTTLRFEPGITCVVGPNGSGKSNVVDALAWVMGEQGAKSLRGGKMEDVVFAGTSARPPLGRAEVVLTIDNTDGALPVDFTEVTLRRTMFRNGGSEYAINGETCRLLDVQELLSDSGIGREMHVVVGQGQLGSVLTATPEDRRGFIEEAAGVLKHRKRKEKALRKLDAMGANLVRLTDLSAELRRQLKPLGRQAEVAKRAATVQADVRDARLRLLADDLLALRRALDADEADETALVARRTDVEAALAAGRAAAADLEQGLSCALPALTRAQETWFRLSALRERVAGTASLAAERIRRVDHLPAPDDAGRDPDQLVAEAASLRTQEHDLAAELASHATTLTGAEHARHGAEAALAAEESRVAEQLRAVADRREGLARLTGLVNGQRSTVRAGQAEIARLQAALDEARARAEHERAEFAALESRIAGLDAGEVDLDVEHDDAVAAVAAADEQLAALREEERAAERTRSALTARLEALHLGLVRKDGAGALLDRATALPGLLGPLGGVVHVLGGAEAALAAALGRAADAVVVQSVGAAVDAIRALKDDDAGRACLLVGGAPEQSTQARTSLPPGASWAIDLVEARDDVRSTLAALLADVVVVDGLAEARALVQSAPDVVAVTVDGDLVGRRLAAGGSQSEPSLLEVQAAVDDAQHRLDEANHASERLRFELGRLAEDRRQAQERVDAALARLHESDARLAAVAEQLGQFGSAARAAGAEAKRIAAAIAAAQAAGEQDRAALADLERRLAAAQDAPDEQEPSTARRDELVVAAVQGRTAETDARLAVRTTEERVRALAGRADALDRAAQAERAVRERTARLRERALRAADVGRAVASACEQVRARLDDSLHAAAQERDAAEQRRIEHDEQLSAQRSRLRQLETELDHLNDSVHRDEVARAEQRLRISQLEDRAVEEHGVDPVTLLAEYGPDQLVPSTEPVEEGDAAAERPSVPYVREEQQKRLRSAEKSLAVLGTVNPLALEEFAALEERHRFLTEQLEDLRKSKRDLLEIVREVDDRIQQVFAEAYHDVAQRFVEVFARLFPGGDGQLVLTEPADLLATGVDIEARPPGKKVKRLSLLSGGERSLTAVAFLIALFQARPSPFYVLDEVEAALDDTNLGRLLEIYDELRANSQLIVVTHQKRTMEVADALYGISMRGDGVSAVVSQRLREAASA